MIARKTIVVPCIVNSWLKVSALTTVLFGPGQLEPDDQRLEPAEQEEDERGDAVEDADPLVVDGGEPGEQPVARRAAAPPRPEAAVDGVVIT